jgi:hypothetical protein
MGGCSRGSWHLSLGAPLCSWLDLWQYHTVQVDWKNQKKLIMNLDVLPSVKWVFNSTNNSRWRHWPWNRLDLRCIISPCSLYQFEIFTLQSDHFDGNRQTLFPWNNQWLMIYHFCCPSSRISKCVSVESHCLDLSQQSRDFHISWACSLCWQKCLF